MKAELEEADRRRKENDELLQEIKRQLEEILAVVAAINRDLREIR